MKFQLIIITLTVAIIDYVSCDPIAFKDCGSTGHVNSIDVSNCSKLPCIFNKGQNYTMKLSFTSNSNSPTADNKVYGIIAGVPVPFPIPQGDACKNGIQCPITSGTTYNEILSLAVLQQYPSLSLYAQLEIVDSSSNKVICALFPAQVKG